MARALNQSRIRDSRLVALATIVIILFSNALIRPESVLHESFEVLGFFFVTTCVVGRIYTTIFLGGRKNEALVTYGPFSVLRNPLYFFSFIGVVGISVLTDHLFIMIAAPILFIIIYVKFVFREEKFLMEKFPEQFRKYVQKTPRFIPSFDTYDTPDVIFVNVSLLHKAILDAIWWFAPVAFIELVDYLHEIGWIKAFFLLP